MTRYRPLPADMQAKWGHLRWLQYKGTGSNGVEEWSSECPVCHDSGHDPGAGDPDRFFITAADGQYNARGKCRRCGHFEWVDQDQPQAIDPVRIKQQEELRREYAEQEAARLRAMINELRNSEYWKGFHDGMKESHRALWRQAGIPDDLQDFWELGFVENKRIKYQDKDYTSPALSIPYFEPGKEPVNIQYRLTNPPHPKDKYRFSYGLEPGLWLADPTEKPSGAVLLCEGMKKAAVTFINTVASGNGRFCVVASPNTMPGEKMLSLIADCEPVYVAFDPDAYKPTKRPGGTLQEPAVKRLYKMLGPERVREVELPAKADDLFVEYGFTASMFNSYLKHAVRVN